MIGAGRVLAASPRPGFKVPDPHELFEFKHCFVGSGTLCVNRVALLMFLATIVVLGLFLLAFRAP